MKNQFANVAHARDGENRLVMEKILAEGHCPFCPENLKIYHKEPILRDGTHWVLTKNQWPYEGSKVHLIAILKKHAVKLEDIGVGAGEELLSLLAWAEKEFSIPGGTFFLRFGDTDYTGTTVQHLHAQFLSGESRTGGGGKEREVIRIKGGYKTNS